MAEDAAKLANEMKSDNAKEGKKDDPKETKEGENNPGDGKPAVKRRGQVVA